jgi:stage II sporulation protein D
MKRCILYLIITLSFAGRGYAYDVRLAMEEADTYLRNGQYLEAMGAYQSVSDLSDEPGARARAILRMGDIYSYFLNNYDRALQKYAVVIKDYGNSEYAANAYFNSGMILYERNRYKEALSQFKTYLRKYPSGDRRDTAEFMVETCSRPPPVTKKTVPVYKPVDEEIRVLIMSGARQVVVSAPSPFDIKDTEEKSHLAGVRSATLDVAEGKIRMNGTPVSPRDVIVIAPPEEYMLSVNGTPYRGKLRIQKDAGNGLNVINVLSIEVYLYGVVPKEMSPQWPDEALKAQAVAARTYGLYQKGKNRDKDYDVLATTSSQVYGGVAGETERSSRAVEQTRGMVLLYGGQLVLSYFHANSGGMTEDAERVWTAEVPYLKSVHDEYSVKAPHHSWSVLLKLDEITNTLNKKGISVESIRKLSPASVSPSGRVSKMRISHRRGDIILSGNDFRMKMGPVLIKSTLFTMSGEGGKIRFEGKGYGHGVGMSQWGAYVMAREGRTFEDILKHYYQGVEVSTP